MFELNDGTFWSIVIVGFLLIAGLIFIRDKKKGKDDQPKKPE